MDLLKFVWLMLVLFVANIVIIKVWMNFANFIGEILGIRKLIDWVINRIDLFGEGDHENE